MTQHRARRPNSKPHARRQLAQVRERLAALTPLPAGTPWQARADRARLFASLEAAERKWERVLRPEPVELYVLPF